MDKQDRVKEILQSYLGSTSESIRQDGWQNVLSNLGVDGKDWRSATKYKKRPELDQGQIETMYEQDALFAKIIDTVPDHAVRRWVTVEASDGPEDFQEVILNDLKRLKAREQFRELLRLERLDGGAAMIIGANDGQHMSQPLNYDSIESVDHLNVLSRHEIFPGPVDRDPRSVNFREPTHYTFAGGVSVPTGELESSKTSIQNQIHWTRVIRAKGIRVNQRQDTARNGWGLPVAERVYEALRQYGTVYEYTEALFKDLVQGVMTIKGLAEILAQDDGKIVNRLTIMSLVASAFNAIILDDGEQYERRTIQLNGIPEVMLKTMDKLSAVAEIPVSILFGQAPTGFSTDDAASRTTFYDAIETKQDAKVRPGLERVIKAILRAKKGPTAGVEPETWSLEFVPLKTPTEGERATNEKTKADTDIALVQAGIIDEDEARTRLEGDPQSPYKLKPAIEDQEIDPDDPAVADLVPMLQANGQTTLPAPAS